MSLGGQTPPYLKGVSSQRPIIFDARDLTVVARATKFGEQSMKFRRQSHLPKMVGHPRTQIFATYSIPMQKTTLTIHRVRKKTAPLNMSK